MKNAKRIATPTDAKGTANKKKRKTLVCEVFGPNNSSAVISDIKLNGSESDIFKSYMNADQTKNERESSGEINSYLEILDSQNNGNQKADGDAFQVDNPLKSNNKNEMPAEMKYSDTNLEGRIDQKHINSGTDFKTTLKLNKPINNTGRPLDNTVSVKNCKHIVSNANAIVNNSTRNQSVAINAKKIISEITQTTAKVSIGNTTISVPLLKPVCSTKIMQDSIDIIKSDNKNKIPLQSSLQKKQGHETNHATTTFNVKCAQHLDAATIASLSQLQVKSAQVHPQTSKNSSNIVQATVLSKKIKLQNYTDITSQASNSISTLREKPSFSQRICYPKEVSVLCHSTLHNKYFEDESKLSTVTVDPSFSLQKQQESQTNNDNEIELSRNNQQDITAPPAANLIGCKERSGESISVGINQNASVNFNTDVEGSGSTGITARKAWYPKANPTFCKSEANTTTLQNIKTRKEITLSSGITISNASSISSQSKLPLTLRTVSSASISLNCNPSKNGPVVGVLNVPQTISLTLSKNLTSETSGTSGIQNVEHRNILDTLGSTKRNSFSKIIALKSNENHYLLQDINKSSYTTAMNHCSKNIETQAHREALTKTSSSHSSAIKADEKYTEFENAVNNSSVKPNNSPKNSKKPQYNGTKISGKYTLSKFDNSGIHTVKSISQEINPTELVSPKSEESQNILLKQLLKSTSAITGQGPVIPATTSTVNSSICSQPLSNRKIINVRAPSLGVVSSLEAQLARPVMPPVPTTTAIISTDIEIPKSEASEEINNLKPSVQIISKETSFVSNPAYSNINTNSNTPEVQHSNAISGSNRFGLNSSNTNLDEHYSEDSINSAESFLSTNSCINKSRNGKNIKTDKKTLSPPTNEQQRQKAVQSENVCSDKNVNITDNCSQFVAEQKTISTTSSTTELIDRSENYREKNNKPQTTSPPEMIYTSHISRSTQNSTTATKIEYNNNNDKITNSIKLFNNSSKPQNCKETSVEAKQRKKRKRQIHNHIINTNNIRTNSSGTETARKRMRKSSKCDEDYDIFMDHLVNQMRKLSSLEILEPIVCYHKGICPIYGSSDTSKFINKEYPNHALNRFFHDRNPLCINNSNFYEEQPFGLKKKLSENNSIMQNRFYDEEFMPHASEMEQNKIYKLFNRTKCHSVNNSENSFTKSNHSLKSYFQWNAFSQTDFPGLVEKNYDNQLLGRQSPVVPYIKPLDLRVGSVVSFPSSEDNSDLFKEKTVSKFDEDRNCVTVVLTLSSSNVGAVLKDLSNLLNISPISSYKLLDIKNTPYSQKEYCKTKGEHMPYRKADIQNILNGSKKACRNCGLPITNTLLAVCLRNNQNVTKNNLGMFSEYSYFCKRTCCLNFKNRLNSKSPKDHNFDSLIKKSEFRTQTHQSTVHELSRAKRCHFKYFKYNNIQQGIRMKTIAQKEVEDILLGLEVAGSQNHSTALECERKDKITKDNRRCYLCNESGDGASDKSSRLLNFDVDKWVHLNCALWSSGVYETVNGGLRNVEIAVQTGSNQMCSHCQQLGATIKCSKSRCESIYHFPCAKEEQGTFYKENIFHCRTHTHQIKTIKNNELCSLNVRRRVFVDQDENRLVAEYLQRQNLDNLLRVGSIIYLSAGQMLLHQLDAFHNSTGTYPVGYKSIRFYWSIKRPKQRCRYLCTIMEIDKRPQFLIKVLDKIESEYVFKESSPNLVWHRILELIMASMKHQQKIQIFPKFVSGEDFFGLTEPLIVRILQSLQDVETLHHYYYYFKNYRNPLTEPALPLHTSGAARTEPQQKHVLGLKKSHTQRTATTTSQRLTNTMVVGEVACPYSKQFVHSKSSQYKKMNQEWRNNVYLARSKIQGLGLYAARDLEKHTMVIEYIGEVIRTEVSEIREKQYAARNRGIYMFRLDEDRIVDATLSGGLARYINHSCNPNCVTEIVDVERELRIIIFAKRRINRGEELSYDYKFDFEDDANKLMCMCGAFNCRKWMN